MSSKDGVWPWGVGPHEFHGSKVAGKCRECEAVCINPAHMLEVGESVEDAYAELCHCCREPLYQLRIEELEAEAEELSRKAKRYRDSYDSAVSAARVAGAHYERMAERAETEIARAKGEQESESVRFTECDGWEIFIAGDGENGLRECRKRHWHREGAP